MKASHFLESYRDFAAEPVFDSAANMSYVQVIDDDPGIVDLLFSLLHDVEGFAVRTAYSVRQVLAESPVMPPALILLDVSLPGEDVLVAAERLHALPDWQHVPVVICSGNDRLDAIAARIGATGYLHKPFDLDEVAAVAERYAQRQRP